MDDGVAAELLGELAKPGFRVPFAPSTGAVAL